MSGPDAPDATEMLRPRTGRRIAMLATLVVASILLIGLGSWQVQRLGWKRDLIARVEARVTAPPVEAPGRELWAGISAASDEYRHVRLEGRFLHEAETLTQAVTDLGPGYWVLTPLERADGTLVIVNRGFVPAERREPASRSAGQIAGPVSLSGLLRLTEPGGAFLRANDPAGNRWYSRDVAAIARARGLSDVAPYFVDADAGSSVKDGPVGGLTQIAFRNNHLVYALTWFALAALAIGATMFFLRSEFGRRRSGR